MSPGCSLSCTTSSEGEKPGDNKGAVGAGLGCPRPPHSPLSPGPPRSAVSRRVCGAGSSPLLAQPHPSERSVGSLVCHLACPTGAKGTSAGGGGEGQRDTGFLATRAPSRSRGGGAAAWWGRTRPFLPRGREGKRRGEGGGCPAVPGRGACSRPWAASGRAGGPQRACALENFVPCPAGGQDEPGRARGAPGAAVRGEVGRGAGSRSEDYSSRRAGAGRVPAMAALPGIRGRWGSSPRGRSSGAGEPLRRPWRGAAKGALGPDGCVRL